MSAIPETEAARHPACTESSLRTLSIDVGGTLIKTAIMDEGGAIVSDCVTALTPKPATPEAVARHHESDGSRVQFYRQIDAGIGMWRIRKQHTAKRFFRS